MKFVPGILMIETSAKGRPAENSVIGSTPTHFPNFVDFVSNILINS